MLHIFKVFFLQVVMRAHLIPWGRADIINSFSPVSYSFQKYFLIRNRNKDQNKSVIWLEIWSDILPPIPLLSSLLLLLLLFKIVLAMMGLLIPYERVWWGLNWICRFFFNRTDISHMNPTNPWSWWGSLPYFGIFFHHHLRIYIVQIFHFLRPFFLLAVDLW